MLVQFRPGTQIAKSNIIPYTPAMKVLIVEDDHAVAEMVRAGLASKSHTVEVAENGADGSFLARSYEYDAIVLDYSLPKKNGLQVCKEIRDAGTSTPIVFLSVNDETSLKVSALEEGADDYLAKPFSIDELNARLKAVARRPRAIAPSVLTLYDLTVDLGRHSAIRAGRRIKLTRKEFNLLEYFMKHPGILLSRSLILEHVWTNDQDPFSNTVETHIRNLRHKINAGRRADLISNIPGRGYVMDTPQNLAQL